MVYIYIFVNTMVMNIMKSIKSKSKLPIDYEINVNETLIYGIYLENSERVALLSSISD